MTRGSFRLMTGLGVLTLGACAWWAWAPLPDRAASLPTLDADFSGPSTAQAHVAIDLEPFRAPLWVAPPPPPPPPQPERPAPTPPPPPPIKYQLLAVLGLEDAGKAGSSDLRAALYDPDNDCILVVRVGEAIGVADEVASARRSATHAQPILEEVNADGVVIRDATGNKRTLALRADDGGRR